MKRRFFRKIEEEDDLSIYSSHVMEDMLEDDELDAFEEAFMRGYEEAAV